MRGQLQVGVIGTAILQAVTDAAAPKKRGITNVLRFSGAGGRVTGMQVEAVDVMGEKERQKQRRGERRTRAKRQGKMQCKNHKR
jgi:2-phospho-L-lactate transferase/gluconeogenesis factor (CofD/UPF0052 family)